MDILNLLKDKDLSAHRKALTQILSAYTVPAFSALPKKEIDLVVLDALISLELLSNEPTLYELVQNLKITRSKARNLLYDRELRRSTQAQLDVKLFEALKSPILQKQGDLFVLEIENPLLTDYLRAKIHKLGYATDASFSPSLTKLSLDAFTALIEDHLENDLHAGIQEALVNAGVAADDSFKGVLKGAVKEMGKKLAQDAGEELFGKAAEYLEPLISGSVDQISKSFNRLFKKSEKTGP